MNEKELKVRSLKPRSNRKLAAAFLAVFLVLAATGLATGPVREVSKQADAFEGHLDTYKILPSGRWVRTGDKWIKDGKSRYAENGDSRFVILRDPSRGYNVMWSEYEGSAKVEVTGPHGLGGNSRSPMPGILTLPNIKNFMASFGAYRTPSVKRTEFNGHPADCVSFSPYPDVTIKLYADPATQRTLGWAQKPTKTNKQGHPENDNGRVFVVDPRPFPPHIFDPVFNISGVPTDVLADRAKWQERLSEPLKVFPVKLVPAPTYPPPQKPVVQTVSVSVRSVVVNGAGDVFVLYTGGPGDYWSRVMPSTIRDATGGRYVKGEFFAPSEEDLDLDKNLLGLVASRSDLQHLQPKRKVEDHVDFSFDGKPLEGGWFIRVGGGAVKGPISVDFEQECVTYSVPAFTYTAEPERIHGDVPAYMPYMDVGVGSSSRNEWLEIRTNLSALERDMAKDFVGEESYLRQLIAHQGERDDPFQRAELLLRLGHALEKQGKKREAYAVYRKAHRLRPTVAHRTSQP